MRIVFVSGVKMGYDCAEALLEEKLGIAALFCLPPSQSGRSGYADFSPLGKKYGVPVFKYEDINNAGAVAEIRGLAPDLVLVLGWSGIIGDEILAMPRHGVLGHHPTLLPAHRGNAPIPWTLIHGLARSGVTLFFLEKEIDRGDIAGQREFGISFEDDAASLYGKATKATAELLLEVIPKIEKGTLKRVAQDSSKASRWGKRRPEDGIIDWGMMGLHLYNWVRGLARPYPGAFTFLGNKRLFVWKAAIAQHKAGGNPGELLDANGKLLVKTGDGALQLLRVQLEGEGEMAGAAFAKKKGLKKGATLG